MCAQVLKQRKWIQLCVKYYTLCTTQALQTFYMSFLCIALASKYTEFNILRNTNSQDPTMLRCTNNTDTTVGFNSYDVQKVWQCPCKSEGRYVYLHLKNLMWHTMLCDFKVYERNMPCNLTQSCEYHEITCLVIPHYLNDHSFNISRSNNRWSKYIITLYTSII